MAKMTDEQRLEKVIKKLHEVIAELEALHNEPMWPSQMESVRNAVLALEDRMKNDLGLFHTPSNR